MKQPKLIIGDDGDVEWLCPHGIGHGENVHTCDGCCLMTKEEIAEHEARRGLFHEEERRDRTD